MRVMFELGALFLNDYTLTILCNLLYLNKPFLLNGRSIKCFYLEVRVIITKAIE